MILTDETTRAKHLESGVWGVVTLDALFRKSAEMHPDRLAIVDATDRQEWTSGTPERLTYAEADHIVSRIAALFSHLGLTPDNVIALMMPNTSATVLTCLAAWRAGLIVAPIPLTWRGHSIRPTLAAIGAKAIVTIDRLEGEDFGTSVRDVAAELFSIRQLLGFGDTLAEGIINIDQAIGEIDTGDEPVEIVRKENAADHVATLTFTGTADGKIVPIPRSHNQWIATGLMPLLETPIEAGSTILSPFMLTGLSGIGGGMIPWLLSGGTLHTHHFRQLSNLADHCSAIKPDTVLCPAALANPLNCIMTNLDLQPNLLAVWPGTHELETPAPLQPNKIIDLTILDELALIAKRRGENPRPHPLPLGPIRVPTGSSQPLTLVEVRSEKVEHGPTSKRETRELLSVRGPMAPATEIMNSYEFVPAAAKGFLETSILARVRAGEPRTAVPVARAGRLMMVGGLPLGANEVDDAYSSHEAVRTSRLYVLERSAIVPKLGLAVVPEHAAPFSVEDARGHAETAGLAEHARPESVVRAASLTQSAPNAAADAELVPSTAPGQKSGPDSRQNSGNGSTGLQNNKNIG